jgi:ketosteroid isomerase-like protein
VTPDDEATTRKEVVVALLTAIATRDRASASRCLADDVTWWVPQSAGAGGLERPLRGREGVLELLCGESRYEVGTMVWEHHQIFHDGNVVIAHSSLRATTRSGRDYENQYALLYRFEALLITEAWEHTDTAYAFSRFTD